MSDDDLIDDVMTFEEETNGVHVAVQSYFLESQSDPDQNAFAWAYRIRITNNSSEAVQLLTRHWIITDGNGVMKEVKGDGVVGEQPLLTPGQSYVYTSGTPLATPSGFMHGSYGMQMIGGKPFDIAIPAFSLDSPYSNLNIN